MNQEVNVTSFYFSNSNGFHSYPRTIELEGKELSFIESGLRCLVRHGQRITQIFNMSDGQSLYRLSFEPEARTWRLLSRRALY